MKWLGLPSNTAEYVDVPQGIFTDDSIWFRTREASLVRYAGGVLEYRTLGELLADAGVWLRSPQTLAVWLLVVLLLVLTPLQAALVVAAFYAAWKLLGPLLVSRTLTPGVRVMQAVVLQALGYVGILSYLAMAGRYGAVVVGLIGFVLLRWGVVRAALLPLMKVVWRKLYPVSVPDHVLRTIIVRSALHHQVTLAEFEPIQTKILEHLKKK